MILAESTLAAYVVDATACTGAGVGGRVEPGERREWIVFE